MTFYLNDANVVMTENEAKAYAFEYDMEQGYVKEWVNQTYTAFDILTACPAINLEELETEYMVDYDLRDAGFESVEISDETVDWLVAEFIATKQ